MDRNEEMIEQEKRFARLKIENKRLKNRLLKKNRKIKELDAKYKVIMADFEELESWHSKVMNAVHSLPIDVESFVGCSRYPEDEEDD
jgi:predicted nuclease with TOPRIM domain